MSRIVRRVGIVCAAVGFSLSAATAFADDFPAEYGYAITGLGDNGDETALVFTNTTQTMEWTLLNRVSSIRYLIVDGGGSGGNTGSNAYGTGGAGGSTLPSQNHKSGFCMIDYEQVSATTNL